MDSNVNHPKHYNFGTPEVIQIIDAWGLAGDFDAGNVLKYFLRAPHKGKEEEDYRKAMWYLERIYSRCATCNIKYYDSRNNRAVRSEIGQLNLEWFHPVKAQFSMAGVDLAEPKNKKLLKGMDVSLQEAIKGWELEGLRAFFIENFYYKNFNIKACLKSLSDLIDEC